MSNGFGFSFPNDGRDDDDDKNRKDGNGQNPYEGFGFGTGQGGLGDILNQFGQMLSGMGDSMKSSNGNSAVNYDMAERIARQQIGNVQKVSAGDRNAVEESVRLADLWLNDASDLPTAEGRVEGRVEAWNAEDWVTNTLPMWKRLVNPVAEQMSRAQLDSMPEEARQMMGQMAQMMSQMNAMNYGMQLGHALGDLAKQALSGSDFGLPTSPSGVTAVLPNNVAQISKDLNVPGQEILVYISAREVARQRLFKHVPWLTERIVASVEEYANGLEIDTSNIEEAARGLNLESGDPQAIQDALNQMQGMDMSPKITSRNAAATSRLETLLALVEGWVDVVVTEALKERFPSEAAMSEAWRRRRATGGSAERAIAQVVGIDVQAPRVEQAAELWRRATQAVGVARRDKVWDHPDFLPSADQLENPASFIDSILDDAPDTKFDEEIAKLEEMLRNEPGIKEREEGDGKDDGSQDGTEL